MCTREGEGEERGHGQREDCTPGEGRDLSCDEEEEVLCSPSESDGCEGEEEEEEEEGVTHQETQIDLFEGWTSRVGLGSYHNVVVVVVVVDNVVEEVVVAVAVVARVHVSSCCKEQEGSEGSGGPCDGVEVEGSWEGEGGA